MEDRTETLPEKQIYQLFKISIILKGLISLAEVILGSLLLVIPRSIIISMAQMLAQYARYGGSYGSILNRVATELDAFTAATVVFLALYLLLRGAIKVVIITGLLKNQLWAYPASLIILGMFVLYQFYQIATQHSIFVILLTLFDLIVMYFIWREYQIVRLHRKARR
jgi:uncharacterized membrane protein